MTREGQDAQVIKGVFGQEKREIILEKRLKKIGEYETDDGMRLILRENGDGQIIGHLEEDLEISNGENKLESLIKILETITTIENVNKKYTYGQKGEEGRKLVAEITLKEIKGFEGLKKEKLKQFKLYRNLQKTLEKRMNEIEKEKRAFPQSSLDDIEYFTRLGVEEEYNRKYNRMMDLLRVADFLRELYGFIEIETGITRKQILSNAKDSKTVRERATVMYILRNKFDFLSSTNIGKIMGEVGNPKNHTTVLLNLKRFNEKDFDPGFYKTGDPLTLYKKAKESYILPPRLLEKN